MPTKYSSFRPPFYRIYNLDMSDSPVWVINRWQRPSDQFERRWFDCSWYRTPKSKMLFPNMMVYRDFPPNRTWSMVIVAWGLLSLLYWTTPAKLLARFSNKFATSNGLSTSISIGSHNLKSIDELSILVSLNNLQFGSYLNFWSKLNWPIRWRSRISTWSNDFSTVFTQSVE